MRRELFSSDLHFFHNRICELNPRPWRSDENTERLIDIWNSQVMPGDTLYHMGDFSFLSRSKFEVLAELIQRLNGYKVFVRGNHDNKDLWKKLAQSSDQRIIWIGDYKEILIGDTKAVLCHYPMEVWNRSHHGTWHLHGHCHGSLPQRGKRLDVGIDNHPEYRFFTVDEIRAHMEQQAIHAPDHHAIGER